MNYKLKKIFKNKSARVLVLLFLVLGGNWFYRNRSRTVGIPASESRELESIKRVSNTGRVSSASISPDGKFVVFKQNTSAGSGTVFIQQLDTNAVRQLIEPSEKTFGCTNFSPDGSLVYYVAADKNYPANALYSVPVLGGTPKLVVSNLGRCFTISPDGKRVAFFRSEPEAKQKKLRETVLQMARNVGIDGFFNQVKAQLGRPDSTKDLPNIKCPTLIMTGVQDKVCTPDLHQEMAALIPNATLRVIEKCGHLSTIEQPQKVNEIIRDWWLEVIDTQDH